MATSLFPLSSSLISRVGVILGQFIAFDFGDSFTLSDEGETVSIKLNTPLSDIGSLIFGASHVVPNAAHFDGFNEFPFAHLGAGNYELTQDTYLTDGAIIDAGVTVSTRGWRLFCNGKLTNNGTISADGNSAIGAPGAAQTSIGSLGFGMAGGDGAQDGGGTAGTDQANGLGDANAIGGKGGNNAGLIGGAGGAYAMPLGGPLQNAAHTLGELTMGYQTGATDGLNPTTFVMGGGAGGGGGAGSTGSGGGGGGGGGVMVLAIFNLVNNGLITAKGGNGANAVGADASGGGGGGGGLINIITRILTGSGTISVDGGIGGQKTATGQVGVNGHVGHLNSFPA